MKKTKSKKPMSVADKKMAEFKKQWLSDDKGEGGGDSTYDKLKDGKNTRRLLPRRDPDDLWFIAYAVHFNVGPDGTDSFRCLEDLPFGHNKAYDKKRNYRAKKCPGCKRFLAYKRRSQKFEFGSKAGKRYWNEKVTPWRARQQYVMAVMRPKSKADKRKVFVLRVGKQIGEPLVNQYNSSSSVGDFVNPVRGRNIVFTRETLSKRATDVKYSFMIMPDRFPIENWEKVKKRLPDLESHVPEELSEEAIEALIAGEGEIDVDDDDGDRSSRKKSKKSKRRGDDDDDDDEDLDDIEDEDEGDADEEARERKLKPKRRARQDDEDVDIDDEEEDDDEDERPSKKSKTKKKSKKLRDKLARSAKRKGDDDEDDDEDEDDDSDDEEDEDDDEE